MYASDNSDCVEDIAQVTAIMNTTRHLVCHLQWTDYNNAFDEINSLNGTKGKPRSPCVFL